MAQRKFKNKNRKENVKIWEKMPCYSKNLKQLNSFRFVRGDSKNNRDPRRDKKYSLGGILFTQSRLE